MPINSFNGVDLDPIKAVPNFKTYVCDIMCLINNKGYWSTGKWLPNVGTSWVMDGFS